ncbi:TPA: hypothetical protein ACTXXA_002080 [Legionella anisa]
MSWIPQFAKDSQKSDDKRNRLNKEIDEAEKNLQKVIEGKRVYNPMISYGEKSSISLLKQLAKNDKDRDKVIISLIEKYPHLKVALRLELHQSANQSSLDTKEVLEYRKKLQEIVTNYCPPYESVLHSTKTLRETLLQLSSKDRIELLRQLDESLLIKLVPNTRALIKLISDGENGERFNSESSLSIINFFIDKEYFKSSIQDPSEVVRFLINCNIPREKRHSVNVISLLKNSDDADVSTINDILVLLDKTQHHSFLLKIGKSYLDKLLENSPLSIINQFRKNLQEIEKNSGPVKSSLKQISVAVEHAWLIAKLANYVQQPKLTPEIKKAAENLHRFIKGEITKLPDGTDANFNDELREIYSSYQKINSFNGSVKVTKDISHYDHNFQFYIIGGKGSGKSSLFRKFAETHQQNIRDFDSTITGFQHAQSGATVRGLIRDFPEPRERSSWNTAWGRRANVFIIAVDLSRPESLREAQGEYDMIRHTYDRQIPVIFVGTKNELNNISEDAVIEFAESNQCSYMSTSAINGNGVSEVFCKAAQLALERVRPELIVNTTNEDTGNIQNSGRRGIIDRFRNVLRRREERDSPEPPRGPTQI